ncbi:MAG: ribonuclease HII [Flavobacteriales bacterium]|nr:ribonuclease HII [Flavobacteriales bacterium]MCB9446893.1 ribonuclease HII [Flavobacteriales bacterium]
MLQKRFGDTKLEAGCDEAGRGCLAGPVFAAAVILPEDFEHPDLDDSKKLSEAARDKLRPFIEKHALSYAVGMVMPVEIDRINILNASFLAMHRAIEQLQTLPTFLLIDGNRFKPYPNIPHECIIKGDGRFQSIAAASVLAKTYRDAYMKQLSEQYPAYNWHRNKGYPTGDHRNAIARHGPTRHHRKSFTLLPAQGKLAL